MLVNGAPGRPGKLLAGLLTWKRATVYASLVGLALWLFWGYSTLFGTPPLTRGGDPIPGDYLAFYAAGRLVLSGQLAQLYDPTAIRAIQAEATRFLIPGLYDPMRNPPFVALAFVPL